MPHLTGNASSARRSNQRVNSSMRRRGPLEVVPELPEKELSDLQQSSSRTQFRECTNPDSDVVWGEWRPQERSFPQRPGDGDSGDSMAIAHPPAHGRASPAAHQIAQGVSEPGDLGAELLRLLALLLLSQRHGGLDSVEELQLLVNLTQHAQLILRQFEQKCLRHSYQQNQVSSDARSSSPLLTEATQNLPAQSNTCVSSLHELVALGSAVGTSHRNLRTASSLQSLPATSLRDRGFIDHSASQTSCTWPPGSLPPATRSDMLGLPFQ